MKRYIFQGVLVFTALLAVLGTIPASAVNMALIAPQSDVLLAQAGSIYIRGEVTNSITNAPVSGVDVTLFGGTVKQIATARTGSDGRYAFENLTVNQDYTVTFWERKYLPSTLSPVAPNTANADIALVPGPVTTPRGVIANSGAKSIFVEWLANPEYNLKGYYIYRTPCDAAGNAQGSRQQLSQLKQGTEYTDQNVTVGQYYFYQVQALSAADRPSELSDPSNPAKGQFLTIFFPDINVDANLEDLYLWDLTPDDLNTAKSVRIPVSVDAIYEVDSTGIDIVAELPTDLLQVETASDIEVRTTGITSGAAFSWNVPTPGEVRISSADQVGRELYGSGILFDIYANLQNTGGCPNDDNLILVEDTYDSDPNNGREGVRIYDLDVQAVQLELDNGKLCTDVGQCIHGDVNMDGNIDDEDVQMVLDLKTGKAQHNECSPTTANINLDRRIDSADATWIQRWIAGLPVDDAAAGTKSGDFPVKGEAPVVWLEGDVTGEAGTQVTLSIMAESGTETLPLAGFTVVVAYPADEGGLSLVSASLSTDMPNDMLFSVADDIVNTYNGMITLSASASAAPSSKAALALADLTFEIVAGNAPGEGRMPKIVAFESNDEFAHTPRHEAPGKAEILDEAAEGEDIEANEQAARDDLCEVVQAQQAYAEDNGVYAGSFDDLTSAEPPYLEGDWDGVRDGYVFTLAVSGSSSYSVNANPSEAGVTGVTYYYVDETGVMRQNLEAAASAADEEAGPVCGTSEGEGATEGEGEGATEGEGEGQKEDGAVGCGATDGGLPRTQAGDLFVLLAIFSLLAVCLRRLSPAKTMK